MASSRPRILSAAYGEIVAVLVVFPGIATPDSEREYQEIIELFDPKGTVYKFLQAVPQFDLRVSSFRGGMQAAGLRERSIECLSPQTDMQSLLEGWENELQVVQREGLLAYRRWAQDPFVVLTWREATIILSSLHQQRLCDFFLPLEIAEQSDHLHFVKPSRLYLEGGNLLMGKQGLLVGKDLIAQNQKKDQLSENAVLDRLRSSLGVEQIFTVGTQDRHLRPPMNSQFGVRSYQFLFHIDLFLTIVGWDPVRQKELLFVGDPTLAANLLQQTKPDLSNANLKPSEIDFFHQTVASIPRSHFHCIPIPIFIYRGTCYSWNNCLIEIFGSTRRAFLPSYQVPDGQDAEQLNSTFARLEKAVASQFDALNFEIVWIRSGRFFRTISQQGGSLHCITKVMRRRSGPASHA